jgi:hypothetical protein
MIYNNNLQNLTTINQLLNPRTHCAIIAESAELLQGYHTINCIGRWDGETELSQIVYGITREAACELASRCGQEFILFKQYNQGRWKLIHTTTGQVAEIYDTVRLAVDGDQNYTDFDGIKFILDK